jgi:hypothetical protein
LITYCRTVDIWASLDAIIECCRTTCVVGIATRTAVAITIGTRAAATRHKNSPFLLIISINEDFP